MTAEQYRRRAVELLTNKQGYGQLQEHQVREADVWARLAISAALSENKQEAHRADQ